MDPPKKITSSEIGTSVSSDFLFNHISKNVSGWISKNINSKISIPISKILVKINSDPNWVTFFVGCIGISCGFFYVIEPTFNWGLGATIVYNIRSLRWRSREN